MVLPLGGSILKYWVEQQYLAKLHVPVVHIYDRDVKKYKEEVDNVNARGDGSWATLTEKYEIENYLHSDAIKETYGVVIDTSLQKVPENFAKVYSKEKGFDSVMKANASKRYLSKVFENAMTYERLADINAVDEIKGWLEKITNLAKR